MGYNTNKMKERAEELLEGYQDARDEAFDEEFTNFIKGFIDFKDIITEDDVQGFIDSFTFPDEGEWAFDAVQSELDDIGDQQYQQWKDERYE